MKYSLLSLVLVVTVLCLFFALLHYGPLVFFLLGGCLALGIWQVIQLGRELRRP
jgi:hypothetical protein